MTEQHDIRIDRLPTGIAIITLNRPNALNAITMGMAELLFATFDELAANAETRVIVLTGAGERAFSAGFDIKEMAAFDEEAMRAAFVARDPLTLRIAEHPLPVIAALNGPALGAGALIAAAADFRIACPAASFKITAIGYESANASWSLPRLVGTARAKEILMTGRAVSAGEALALGLYDRVAEDALEVACALAHEIARNPQSGIIDVKRLVNAAPALSPREGWESEHAAMLEGFARQAMGGSAVFASFLAKPVG